MSSSNENSQSLDDLIGLLSESSRRTRQQAAKALAQKTIEDASTVAPFIPSLVKALNNPEAQTRWEILDALTRLIALDAGKCVEALAGAETALFDEDSGPLRLAAVRFLCKLGSVSADYSDMVSSLIDEAIQCYHGDLEFQDMLVAVSDYAKSSLSDAAREQLISRMTFDAENGKGALKNRAQLIIQNATK